MIHPTLKVKQEMQHQNVSRGCSGQPSASSNFGFSQGFLKGSLFTELWLVSDFLKFAGTCRSRPLLDT
jgi:hypothetical protein